jgi:hypothetical protein
LNCAKPNACATMVRIPPKSRVALAEKKAPPTPRRSSPRRNQSPRKSPSEPSPEPTSKKQKLVYEEEKSPSPDVTTKKVRKPAGGALDDVRVNSRSVTAVHAGQDWGSEEGSLSEESMNEDLVTLNDDKSNMAMTKTIIKNKKKYPTLKDAETHALSHFIRRTLFRRIKFLNDSIMHGILDELYKKLEITDPEDRKTKTSDLIKCTRDTLSSRRGYSNQIIINKLRSK